MIYSIIFKYINCPQPAFEYHLVTISCALSQIWKSLLCICIFFKMKYSIIDYASTQWNCHLTTITTGPGFLGNFVRLSLKTCSRYHEKLFIQVVNDISSQVFNNFFSASDIMEAVRGRFRVWYEGCVIQVILLRNKWVGIGIAYELIPLRGGGGHIPPRFG